VSEIAVLRAQAALTAAVAEAALADVSHEESLRTPIPGVNAMNWVAGHLANVNAGILELLEHPGDPSSRDLAHYAPGTPAIGDAANAWDIAALRQALQQQAPRIDQALADARPALLAGPPPPGFEGELRSFLHFIAFHQGYHVGQLGMLRKALGHERAFG
jgi:uncharacterized damage-inducible protein DinB